MQYLLAFTPPAHSRAVPIAVTEPNEARARGRAEFELAEYIGELAVRVDCPEVLGNQYAEFAECDTRVQN